MAERLSLREQLAAATRRAEGAEMQAKQRELDIDQICEALGYMGDREARRSPIAMAQRVFAQLGALEDQVRLRRSAYELMKESAQQAIKDARAAEAERDTLKLALNEAETIANVVNDIIADAHHDGSRNCRFAGAYGDGAVGCLACLAQDELAKINADRLRDAYVGCPAVK